MTTITKAILVVLAVVAIGCGVSERHENDPAPIPVPNSQSTDDDEMDSDPSTSSEQDDADDKASEDKLPLEDVSDEEETDEPVVEDETDAPVEEETDEPVVEDETDEPVVEDETDEPVVEDETDEPIVEPEVFIITCTKTDEGTEVEFTGKIQDMVWDDVVNADQIQFGSNTIGGWEQCYGTEDVRPTYEFDPDSTSHTVTLPSGATELNFYLTNENCDSINWFDLETVATAAAWEVTGDCYSNGTVIKVGTEE